MTVLKITLIEARLDRLALARINSPTSMKTTLRRLGMVGMALVWLAGAANAAPAKGSSGNGGNKVQVSRQLDATAKPGTRDTYTYIAACEPEREPMWRAWFWWLGRRPLR